MADEQIRAGSLLSYIQMALNIIISLVYTPLMIKLLGQSEYGLYNTVASTVSMLSILNMGFGSGYIRYYSKYKACDDEESIQKLNGLFLLIFGIIAFIVVLCGTYLTTHLNIVFQNGLTSEEYSTARTLMCLLTLNLSVSFPMSVFSNIISAHERFIFLKIAGMGKSVLSPILTIPLLLLGYGSIGVVTITVIVSLIVDFLYVYYVLAELNQKFVFHGFEKGIFKSLFTYTGFIAINVIVDQINWNIDKLLLGRYMGTAMVAIYAVGANLQTYYNMLSTAVSNVFTPRIHYIANSEDTADDKNEKLTSLFLRVGRIQFLILALVCSGFVFFGKPFIRLWAGGEYEEAYVVALLLMIPVTIPLIQNLGIEIQRAQNKHKFRSLAYAVMATLNLIMTVYLCQIYGATGAAFGTAISLVLANGIVMNIYYHKSCGLDVVRFWKSIGRLALGMLPSFCIGMAMMKMITVNSWITLIGCSFVYGLCYSVSVWFLSISREEKELIRGPLRRLVNR